MNDEQILISSLAMDLKRVAIGLHKSSFTTAERFKKEALARQEELVGKKVPLYILNLIQKSKESLTQTNERSAEDALMYSTLFQNFVTKKMNKNE